MSNIASLRLLRALCSCLLAGGPTTVRLDPAAVIPPGGQIASQAGALEITHPGARLPSMNVIGLAGPAGSGKSTVARRLAVQPGFARLDCDELAWATYRPGGPAYAALVGRFGTGILAEDGAVDRARLARAALVTPRPQADLEAIVHPIVMCAVRAEIARHRAAGTRTLVVEGALLLSSPHVDRSIFDAFVWLSVPMPERRRRLLASGLDREVVERRLAAQQNLGPPPEPDVFEVDAQGSPADVTSRVLALLV